MDLPQASGKSLELSGQHGWASSRTRPSLTTSSTTTSRSAPATSNIKPPFTTVGSWPGPALGEQQLAGVAATAIRASAMLARMSAQPVRNISETILDFGEPLFSQLDPALPLDAVQSIFEVVVTVWNAHVMAMPRWGQPRFLADLHERMQDPQIPPEMVDAMRTLSQRRLERFANDGRAVGEWSLVMETGQWRLRCDARVPTDH